MTDDYHITVKLATVLAKHTDSQKVHECDLTGNKDLASVLDNLDGKFPGIKSVICKDGLEIVDSINVYMNGDNVRYLHGMGTPLKQGDIVNIIPAAAAG